MQKQHIAYFDLLRGIAIIFVIINHCYTGNPLEGTLKEELYLIIRQLSTCAVPLFLAESGFFLADKVLNTPKEYWAFFSSHSFRVWLPMVLWSLPLFFIQDHHNIVLSIIFLLLGGYSIYYFITLIIQYYALQPLMRKINRGGVICSLIITLVAVAVDNYITSFKGHHMRLFFECAPFYMWLVYPALGYYIKKNGRNYKLVPWLVIMAVSLVGCVLESKWLYEMSGEGLGVTKISAVLFSCSALMVLFNQKVQGLLNERGFLFKMLVYIGEISFGIYLIHKYFVDFILEYYISDTLLMSACTLMASIITIQLVKKLIPHSICKWIGFR